MPTWWLLSTLLTGCTPANGLPKGAALPIQGERTDIVAELDLETTTLRSWWTHPEHPEWLLVAATTDGLPEVWLYDAAVKSRTLLCNATIDDPLPYPHRPDAGVFDVLDGGLVYWAEDGAVHRCEGNLDTALTDSVDLDPDTLVPAEDSWVAQLSDGTFTRFERLFDGFATVPVPDGIIAAGAHPDGLRSLVAVWDGVLLKLVAFDPDRPEFTDTLLQAAPAIAPEVVLLHPKAFLWTSGDTLYGQSVDVDEPPAVIGDPDLLVGDPRIVINEDGSGFVIPSRNTSVRMIDGRTYRGGTVVPGGWHYDFGATLWSETTVTVWANNASGTADAAHATYEVDLGLEEHGFEGIDDFGSPGSEPGVWAFGTGLCVLGRLGTEVSEGYSARPDPEEPGDLGWKTTPTRLYATRCGAQPEREITRGLAVRIVPIRAGGPKTDVPLLLADFGTFDGSTYTPDSPNGFTPVVSGWALDRSGNTAGLWMEMREVIAPERGTAFWVMDGTDLRWVEARSWF